MLVPSLHPSIFAGLETRYERQKSFELRETKTIGLQSWVFHRNQRERKQDAGQGALNVPWLYQKPLTCLFWDIDPGS